MAKRKRFKITKRGVVLLVALVAVISLGRTLIVQQIELNSQRASVQSLNEAIEAANRENKRYERELNFAKTDAYIERVAHEVLGFVRDGEYKFVEDQQ